jgi:neutral ceramidase
LDETLSIENWLSNERTDTMRELKAGASKMILTPPPELMPFPNPLWFGGGKFGSVKKDIYARAIAIDNGERTVLIIAGEIGGFANTDMTGERICRELGIDRENVWYCGTHNHECPMTFRIIPENEIRTDEDCMNNAYSLFAAGQVFLAAQEAIRNLQPARFGYGTGKSYINCNRDEELETGCYDQGRNFKRPSDKSLGVIKFEALDGDLIAVIINYAVHNNLCFLQKDDKDKDLMIYGDISGEVCHFVEERYRKENAVALWLNGAAGNQNPIWFSGYHRYNHDKTHNYYYYKCGFEMWGLCEHLGQTQGVDVLRVMNAIRSTHRCAKITMHTKGFSLPGTKVTGFTHDMILNSDIIDNSKIFNVPDEPVTLDLSLLTLDDLALYGIGGEVMCETGLRIKELSALKDTWVVSILNEKPDGKYLVDEWGYDNRTFAYYRNRIERGVAERCILDGLDGLLEDRFDE